MMKKLILLAGMIGTQLLSVGAVAGQDPVSWTISPAGGLPAQTQVGNSYAYYYTLTNNSPVPLTITTPDTYSASTVTVDDRCNNQTLSANGGSCVMYFSLQPARPASHTIITSLNYGNTKTVLPTVSTTAAANTTVDNITGYITQPLPPNTQVGTSYPVKFTFQNNGISNVTATAVNVSGFAPSTNTCTSQLSQNGSCVVQGSYTPAASGQNSVSVSYVYTIGSSKSVALATSTISSSSGTCNQLTGYVTLPFAYTSYIYGDNVAKFTFTNHCDSGSVSLGAVNLSATFGGSPVNQFLTKGNTSGVNDTCSNSTLGANQSCNVYVSAIPTMAMPAGTPLSVSANVPYNSSSATASAVTTTLVYPVTNQTTAHAMMFINQCDYPVWLEFLNGNGGAASTGVLSPDPMPASTRTPDDYKIPGQAGGAPSVKTLIISQYENGKINARTGCDYTSSPTTSMVCKTASCVTISGKGTCGVGQGAGVPSTAFEAFMTGTAATDGVYDVSLVNGFNVPIEIKGLGPTSSTDPFACSAAGAVIQPQTSFATQLGVCPWTFTPPSTGVNVPVNYVFVSSAAESVCNSDSDCTAPEVCGMGYTNDINTGAGVPINRHCGTFQGYWSVADFIGYTNTTPGVQWDSINLYTTYSMGSSLAPTYPGYANSTKSGLPAQFSDLFGCIPTTNDSLDSGYKANKSRVCGCYDWNQGGSPALTAVSQACCISGPGGACGAQTGVVNAPNSLWQNNVFDKISFLKAACPTAYSYQFDDKSSSFQCNQAGKFTGYVAIFCPGGKTGFPA